MKYSLSAVILCFLLSPPNGMVAKAESKTKTQAVVVWSQFAADLHRLNFSRKENQTWSVPATLAMSDKPILTPTCSTGENGNRRNGSTTMTIGPTSCLQ